MLNVCVYVPLVTPPGKPVNVGVVVATPALAGAVGQQWMCAAMLGVVRPAKSTMTVMVLVVVSQNTVVVPVAVDSGCAGLSLSPLRPGAFGPSATNSSAALPVSARPAVASSFLPLASSVAAPAGPDAVGAYSTVTVHDFRGPRLVSLQLS